MVFSWLQLLFHPSLLLFMLFHQILCPICSNAQFRFSAQIGLCKDSGTGSYRTVANNFLLHSFYPNLTVWQINDVKDRKLVSPPKNLSYTFPVIPFCIFFCTVMAKYQDSNDIDTSIFISRPCIWRLECQLCCYPLSPVPSSHPSPYSLWQKHTWGSLHPMQRWHSPWMVCITPPPPPLPPPVFKSAASTHTLWRWLSTWLAPLQREYLSSFLCAAECVLLGLCSDGWVDLSVLWIILTVTAAHSCSVQNVRFPGDGSARVEDNAASHLAGKETGICRLQQKIW